MNLSGLPLAGKPVRKVILMSNTSPALARRSYEIINEKASSNIVIQGLSGVLGFPFTLLADGAVIFTHYGTMLNEIRSKDHAIRDLVYRCEVGNYRK